MIHEQASRSTSGRFERVYANSRNLPQLVYEGNFPLNGNERKKIIIIELMNIFLKSFNEVGLRVVADAHAPSDTGMLVSSAI